MPAASSSPIDPGICHLLAAVEGVGGGHATVVSVLAGVADPRARRGVRHRLVTILGLAVCAVLAGARSFTAIAEWAAGADEVTLAELGVTGVVPCESTIWRTLQRLDADDFGRRAGAWAQQRTMPPPGRRRLVAVDGKTLRGSASGADPGQHLLAALDHARGVVLGQAGVQAKTNECVWPGGRPGEMKWPGGPPGAVAAGILER
jgi:DDE_Tnp_1-associated